MSSADLTLETPIAAESASSAVSSTAYSSTSLPGEEALQSRVNNAAYAIFTVFREICSFGYSIYFHLRYRSWKQHFPHLHPDSLTKEQADEPAIIFIHGDGGDQRSVIDLANQVNVGVSARFLLDMKFDDSKEKASEIHLKRLETQLSEIQKKYTALGKRFRPIFVGHSKGVTFAALFLNKMKELESSKKTKELIEVPGVIALAGRLKVIPARWPRNCHPAIRKEIEEVNETIKKYPQNFYAIIPQLDWIMPRAAQVVPILDHNVVIPGTSHHSISLDSSAADQVSKMIAAIKKSHSLS